MQAQVAAEQKDIQARQANLLRLHWQLTRLGVRATVRKPRNGRWKLKLHTPDWSETVLCAGADGVYAYVTVHGRLLGAADDAQHIARVLLWMLEGRRR